MPINKDAYLRYRIIDQCLINSMHAFPNKEYIREKVEEVLGPVSLSSLEKDFGKMKEIFSAPIAFDRVRKGYYYDDPNFSIKEFPLNEEEIRALDFSTAVLGVLRSSPIFNKFEGAIDKVINGYRVGKLLDKSMDELIQVESPIGNNGGQWIEPLYKSILEKQVVRILYEPFGREAKEHHLSPYLLKEYRNRWYVIGFSARAEAIIVFALDRIRIISPSNQNWVSSSNFNPKEYFKYSFGVTQINNAKPEKVILSFALAQANYILTQPLHPSQKILRKNLKEVRIEITVYLTHELTMMILGYGENVKVISPRKLVKTITNSVEATYTLYNNK